MMYLAKVQYAKNCSMPYYFLVYINFLIHIFLGFFINILSYLIVLPIKHVCVHTCACNFFLLWFLNARKSWLRVLILNSSKCLSSTPLQFLCRVHFIAAIPRERNKPGDLYTPQRYRLLGASTRFSLLLSFFTRFSFVSHVIFGVSHADLSQW